MTTTVQVSLTSYCYANLEPTDEVFNSDPNPLAQLINLRGQAEKASETQQMYDQRVGGWLEWEDVQKARVKCLNALAESGTGGTPAQRRSLLRDAAAISLLSLLPPDRVGIIRKLRLGHTLKRKPGGGFKLDLSRLRDGHKTSRFYGPFASSLPAELTPVLDQYVRLFDLEPDGGTAFLFHPPNSGFDRSMEPSPWTGWVRRLFKRWHGEEIAPKTLRSAFITWLRDSTTAPEILKSAAHAMKHSEARQASESYDAEADDRLVRASYEFNLQFASQFKPSGAEQGAGSSAAQGAGASATRLPPLPEGELDDAAIEERLALLECEWVGNDQTELRGTARTDVDGVVDLLNALGADVCKLTVPDRVYSIQRSEHGARALIITSELPPDLLVDEQWLTLEGGPWTAKLMRPSRQPKGFRFMMNLNPCIWDSFLRDESLQVCQMNPKSNPRCPQISPHLNPFELACIPGASQAHADRDKCKRSSGLSSILQY